MAQASREKGMLEKFEEFTGIVSGLEKSMTLDDLLTDSFLKEYTQFENLAAFKDACGGKVESLDDLSQLSDSLVQEKTKFSTAEDFMNKAVEVYIASVFSDEE